MKNFISNTNTPFNKNVSDVDYNNSLIKNFYHPYSFIFPDDVRKILFKDGKVQNKYCYIFLKQRILQQKEKYYYTYKFNGDE